MRLRMIGCLGLVAGVIFLRAADSPGGAYDQPYRGQFHFSPRENWTNDPNGLVYFEGEYHLFYQYNPFGDQWGHMSWGHAVSRDLAHWQQLPVAIPEENGIMIFTGSTVVDQNNSSGFCRGGKPCMVAVYTGHTPPKNGHPALQTQNVAYSNDRGRTWTKYARNPVLDLHMSDFRDPKVFWSKQSARWTMAVSLPDDHKVRMYGSKDLKSWSQLSDFGPAGATGGQWECPELFELPVEGGNGETRWLMKVGLNPGGLQGGSGEQYFVGKFDGTRFVNDNPASLTLWTDYGKDCYCALTFNNLPQNQKTVMIGWMDNWQYAKDLPTHPWRGQMTVPRGLALRKTSEGLRLMQTPAEQLRFIDGPSKKGTVDTVNSWLAASTLTNGRTYRLQLELPLGSAQQVELKLLTSGSTFTSVRYDKPGKKLVVDRSHSGVTGFNKQFPGSVEAALALPDNTLRLDVVVDRNSVEVFGDSGRVAITSLVFAPLNARGAQISASGGTPGEASVKLVEVGRTLFGALEQTNTPLHLSN